MTNHNRKTNLGMILLLTVIFAFGVAAALSAATMSQDGITPGEALRLATSAGIAVAASIALGTYSVLVIRKAKAVKA